jgi:hypothetical protein
VKFFATAVRIFKSEEMAGPAKHRRCTQYGRMKSAKDLMSNHVMMPPLVPVPVVAGLTEDTPFIIEFYMVQGVGFRCAAYRDQDGKWRDAFNNEELFGEIQILE